MSLLWLIDVMKALKAPYCAKIHFTNVFIYLAIICVHDFFLCLDTGPCDVTKVTHRMEIYIQPDVGSAHSEHHGLFFLSRSKPANLQQSISFNTELNDTISVVFDCKQRVKYVFSSQACNFHIITNL